MTFRQLIDAVLTADRRRRGFRAETVVENGVIEERLLSPDGTVMFVATTPLPDGEVVLGRNAEREALH